MAGLVKPDGLTSRSRGLLLAMGSGALAVGLATGLVVGRDTANGSVLLTGTVAIVNWSGSKVCVDRAAEEQWCGRLATSAAPIVKVGQLVTVLVQTVHTPERGEDAIGTVVPEGTSFP